MLTAAVKLNVAALHPSALKRVNVDVYENTVINDLVVRSGEDTTAAASPTPVAASTAPPSKGPPRGSVRRMIPGVTRMAPAWPGGPDHAFNRDGKAAQDLAESDIRNLPTDGRLIDHVSVYALVNRGVVSGPRYAIMLWHVNEAAAAALLR